MTTDREVLAELVAACDGFWSDDGNKLRYIKALSAARARLAPPETGRWISVTERLPQVHGVLHPVILAGEKPKLWMGFMAGGGWEPTPTECEEDDAREVTHWFELPPLLPNHHPTTTSESGEPKATADRTAEDRLSKAESPGQSTFPGGGVMARLALPEAVHDEIRALYGDQPISADAPELSMSMFASKDDLTDASELQEPKC